MFNYREASTRFYDAARALENDARKRPVCSHLLGLVAECALSAIMVGLGAASWKGRLEEENRVHVDRLWNEYQAFLSGRGTEKYRLSPVNPFEAWRINHRYCSDDWFSRSLPDDRFKAYREGAEECRRVMLLAHHYGDSQ